MTETAVATELCHLHFYQLQLPDGQEIELLAFLDVKEGWLFYTREDWEKPGERLASYWHDYPDGMVHAGSPLGYTKADSPLGAAPQVAHFRDLLADGRLRATGQRLRMHVWYDAWPESTA